MLMNVITYINPKCLVISAFMISVSVYFYNSYLEKVNLSFLGSLPRLAKCPACYGMSACTALYSGHVTLSYTPNNNGNTYYGVFKHTKQNVALKRLASELELQTFDETLCETWGLESNCEPMDLYRRFHVKDIKEMINKSVAWNFTTTRAERGNLVFCPSLDGLYEFLKPVFAKNAHQNTFKANLIHIWTMLQLNVEPILLQVMHSSHYWFLPTFGGCCGRLELVSYKGVPLSSLSDLNVMQRYKIARSLLEAALDMTFRNERFRFYIPDWSSENILVTEDYDITFANLDYAIVLDTRTTHNENFVSGHEGFPLYSTRYHRRNDSLRYARSHEHITNLCSYHVSDHNFWELCRLLAGNDNPILLGHVKNIKLVDSLESCRKEDGDKFTIIWDLQMLLDQAVEKHQYGPTIVPLPQ